MNPLEYRGFYERNLPHFQPPEATLFVTFRLDGSLPEVALEQWRIEKKRLEMTLLRWAAISPPGTIPDPEAVAEEKLKYHRRWFRKFEELLDGATTGPMWLKEDRVASIVDEALRYRDGVIYRLDAYCVMPNHVHAVFAPFLTEELARELADKAIRRKRATLNQLLPADIDEETCQFVLASIMDSLKGWTARRCNRTLNRRGQFWQHESYDHVIRNQAEWERVVNYVVKNPVKAGLVADWKDWKWSYRRQRE
ncbi:MAG TPA: transposase [Blastocatellia bacterium]|nr:transposase [Blastocatellia bacterium]